MNQRGFIAHFMMAIIVAATLGIGIYWYDANRKSPDGKPVSFSELMGPIWNTSLKYKNPDVAFQTLLLKGLKPTAVQSTIDGQSLLTFTYAPVNNFTITRAEIKVLKNHSEVCIDNPKETKVNRNGIMVDYTEYSYEDEHSAGNVYTRSLQNDRDKFCIQAVLQRKVNDPLEDEITRVEFERTLDTFVHEFKVILY
ncbi:MAG: hypothetical protein V4686_03705 [Patescibacteria group bacterium]